MTAGFTNNYNRILIAALASLWAASASAQGNLLSVSDAAAAEQGAATLSVSRDSAVQPLNDGSVADSINIGVVYAPASNGLQLRAGAWQMQSETTLPAAGPTPPLSLRIDGSFSREQAFSTDAAMPQGIDLSASYVWESPRFGQFTLSTKASYIYDFQNQDSPEAAATLGGTHSPLLGSELQSSLTLTWQSGKHRASAVTNYADKLDPQLLDVEELNRLVDNLTTVDLQYGYTLKAGRDGEAVISVGVRSVLDDRAGEFINASPVGTENSGRMAYGTIKYQF